MLLFDTTSERPRRRKNGIDTANVGIRDNPKATITAEGPVNAFWFELDEDDDEDKADVDGRETVRAGSDSGMTAPVMSLDVSAGGLGSNGNVATSDSVWEFKFVVPWPKEFGCFPLNIDTNWKSPVVVALG